MFFPHQKLQFFVSKKLFFDRKAAYFLPAYGENLVKFSYVQIKLEQS